MRHPGQGPLSNGVVQQEWVVLTPDHQLNDWLHIKGGIQMTPRLKVLAEAGGAQSLAGDEFTPLVDLVCFQQWNAEHGNPSALFYQLADGYLVRFPDIADFHVSSTGEEIACTPAAGSGERWRPVYQQQVLPLLPSLTGDPVYHGGGIAMGDVAIAFLGPSGCGKSTLTTAFATRGHAFLGDDCLQLVRAADGRVQVQPHASQIRLWDDSIEALAPPHLLAGHMPGSPKPHLAAAEGLRHCERTLPLARVYVLGDGTADSPMLTPLTAAQMIMAWTRNAFVFDIKSPAAMRRSFDAATRLALRIPARQLDYPRRYEVLDDVVACVLADLQTTASRL